MAMTFSVGDLSALVQMIISVFGLLVSLVTLLFLVRYASDTKRLADDTKRLADISVRQIEEVSVPYLTVRWIPQGRRVPGTGHNSDGGWYLFNVGRGPALNVSSIGKKADGSPLESHEAVQHRIVQMDNLADVIVDAPMLLAPPIHALLKNGNAIEFMYVSLTGLRYRSLITEIGRLQSKVVFSRVADG
jgi:hypothetical protein